MSLTVLSVAYPFAPVGEDAAGGAEQVLGLVERGLVRRGHRSIVVACQGSRPAGELVPTAPLPPSIDESARRRAWGEHRRAIGFVLDREPVDLVHLHGVDFHQYLPPAGVPVLATLHLPPSFYPDDALRPLRPATFLQCVSRAQREACPKAARISAVVPNGVPVARLERLPLAPPRGRQVVALGRICPEKGFHLALEAAHRADVDLCLAGELFPYDEHRRHFEQEIRPRLDSRRVFLGPVGLEAKRRLLSSALAVLVPSLVEETSSLVAMEALACGTPVIAFARRALGEIVEHGRTGFLVSDVAGMAAAIPRAEGIDPEACRATARDRFSAEAMVERYLDLYRRILRPGREQTPGPLEAAEA